MCSSPGWTRYSRQPRRPSPASPPSPRQVSLGAAAAAPTPGSFRAQRAGARAAPERGTLDGVGRRAPPRREGGGRGGALTATGARAEAAWPGTVRPAARVRTGPCKEGSGQRAGERSDLSATRRPICPRGLGPTRTPARKRGARTHAGPSQVAPWKSCRALPAASLRSESSESPRAGRPDDSSRSSRCPGRRLRSLVPRIARHSSPDGPAGPAQPGPANSRKGQP